MAKSRKMADLRAPLPGEAAMLSAVVANLGDDDVKLVYADWLEEHDDPRGAFLRQFLHAVQKGEKLPGGRGISAAWQEIVFWYIKTADLKKGRFENTQAIDG